VIRALAVVSIAWLGGLVFGGALKNYPVAAAIPSVATVLFAAALLDLKTRWKPALLGAGLMVLAALVTAYEIVGIDLESGATRFSPMVWIELAAATTMVVFGFLGRAGRVQGSHPKSP
jgi:hypothetical protein